MHINLFKRKQKEASKPVGKKEPTNVATPEDLKKKKNISPFSFTVLRKPHITEKASALTHQNQYVFEILQKASKAAVKEAVEKIYGVHVEQVRVARIPSKTIRVGRREGIKQGYKKAMVKLRKGEKIEVLPR